jgi:alpha-glucuronidase
MQQNGEISQLRLEKSPAVKLRILNHWENPGNRNDSSSIERGYAGSGIFKWNELPEIDKRYTDYARLCASVGINATVINSPNTAKRGLEGWKLLTPEYYPKLRALSNVFKNYGIKLYISVNFFSPVIISNYKDADPLNPEVQQWWEQKVAELYREVPNFGGFLVKADSEGEPGPMKYGRTHAEGANIIAKALEPFGGIVMWRAFVYGREKLSPDRACQAYEIFKPLDGSFADNVLIQIKNGPIDFQVREPVSPLFGAMPETNQILELQITQEYTGHSTHICYLVPQWKEILDFDTYAKGKGSTVNKVIDGTLFGYEHSGIAGVSNFGDDLNWTGHILAQANAYGFGRLTWDPGLAVEHISKEWIHLTFGNDRKLQEVIGSILHSSWLTYENYTSPLGVGVMCNAGGGVKGHYDPAPSIRVNYHQADCEGVGYDRTTKSGSGYTNQYFNPVRATYERLETCPEELLLFFHHVPYTYELKSGKTVIQHIYDSHNRGVKQVKEYKTEWGTLEGLVDEERFIHVSGKLEEQIKHAGVWRDSINQYFHALSEIGNRKK